MKERATTTSSWTQWGNAWERFWLGYAAVGGPDRPNSGLSQPAGPPYDRLLTHVRTIVALAGLVWLLALTPVVVPWLSGDGWLTIPAMRRWWQSDPTFAGGLYISFWNWIDAPSMVWGVHAASIVCLGALAIGWGGRLGALLAWWVVISYIQRLNVLSGAFEHVLASFMLYLVLAPGPAYGAKSLSIGNVQPDWLKHLASRLMAVHLSLLYGVMGLSKLASGVWWNGEGAWWILSQAESPLVDWTFLRSSGLVVDLWTHSIVLCELAVALLMWFPAWRSVLRWIALIHWTLLGLITGDVPLAGLMAGLTWTLLR